MTTPILSIIGGQVTRIEATLDLYMYEDEGATCSDYVDGILPVVVRPYFVNASILGLVPITYTCTNSRNITATKLRKLFVIDTICPICKLNLAQELIVEASFPWQDPGANCSDTFSSVTQNIVTNLDVMQEGIYKVTYQAVDTSGNAVDGTSVEKSIGCTTVGASSYIRTDKVADTLKPVLALSYNNQLVGSTTTVTPFMLMQEETSTATTLLHATGSPTLTLAGVLCFSLLVIAIAVLLGQRQKQLQPVVVRQMYREI